MLQPLVMETTTGLHGNNLVVKPNQLIAGAAYRFTLGVTSSGGFSSSHGSSFTSTQQQLGPRSSQLLVKWCQ